MIMSLIVIAAIGVLAYLWSARGFFSGFLHLINVLAAGAIAFAFWELVAGAVLGATDSRLITDIAIGGSLILLFAVTLTVLHLAVTALVPGNLVLKPAHDLIGGGLCGAAAAFVSMGILVIGLSHVRLPRDFLGYRPVVSDSSGSVVRSASLWVPADRLTAALYRQLSVTAFSTADSLAYWHPLLAERGHLNRSATKDAVLKSTLLPADVTLVGRYTVGRQSDVPLAQFLAEPGQARQNVKAFDGSDATTAYGGQAYVEAVGLVFGSGAREPGNSQIIYAPGHAVLLMSRGDGSPLEAFLPFGLVSQAEGSTQNLGRWRFDGQDAFVASVGAAANPVVFYEFLVPKTNPPLSPVALDVRGVRIDLSTPQTRNTTQPTPITAIDEFPTPSDRLDAVASGLLREQAVAQRTALDATGAPVVSVNPTNLQEALRVSQAFFPALNKGVISGLTFDDNNRIIDGEWVGRPAGGQSQVIDRNLRVAEFGKPSDIVIIQLNVSGRGNDFGLLSARSGEASGAPLLVAADGQQFECVGWLYEAATEVRVRYTPSRPVRQKSELPSLSSTRDDQKLVLIFRAALNTTITSYAIGSTVIATLERPIELNTRQGTR